MLYNFFYVFFFLGLQVQIPHLNIFKCKEFIQIIQKKRNSQLTNKYMSRQDTENSK